MFKLFLSLLFCIVLTPSFGQNDQHPYFPGDKIIPGAEQPELYLSLLKKKKIALVVNQTSSSNNQHLLDFLISKKVNVIKVFSPEHGFRGDADAGEKVKNTKDEKTGIAVISLYGDNKKPKPEQLTDVDLVIFDIQDVGARFYTYLSTLHYVMEACAENKKELLILDRPNPNGEYVDGPILDKNFSSFVGIHPIPIVHGMTLGELAQMINGEKWLKDSVQCQIKITPCKNYTHLSSYYPPVKPSPNLPNLLSIKLYPSLCLFEGTNVSVGRGTETPFQILGVPDSLGQGFSFTPKSISGMAKKPLYENKRCTGIYLGSSIITKQIDLYYLILFYNSSKDKTSYFNNFFNKLAGNAILQEQIKSGLSAEEIRKTWVPGLQNFKSRRKNYLLYTDFE